MGHRLLIFPILVILSLVVIGCGEDINLPMETLKVKDIIASQSTIGPGDTATIEAIIDYTGDKTVLMYTWDASSGFIQGTGSKVTYRAPETSGNYSISLTVTDGAISSGKTIGIIVSQQSTAYSLILDKGTYWPASEAKDKLAYDVKVNKISGGRILLHYDITQDKDDFDAFFSIEINNKIIQPEMAIGNEQPSTAKRTIRDVDVSDVIKATGRYMIVLYIRPGNRAQEGWLLNEAKLVGAEGTSDPQ